MSEDAEKYDISVSFLSFLLGFVSLISIMLIFDGLISYESDSLKSIIQLGAGLSGLIFVVYTLRRIQMKFSMLGRGAFGARVLTTEVCLNCNYSNVRAFKEGDYIHAIIGQCPKCNVPGSLIIKAIFLQKQPKKRGL